MSTDRLYDLLPAVYRIRDEAHGRPLQALLRVVAEQVDLLEEDIARLHDNWFIETCDDWVVPYIGELVGYRSVPDAGTPGATDTAQGRARNRVLVPRREVANTIGYRRRKGTLALLEQLANDVAGWPARAVEYYASLCVNQALNQLRPDRAHTVDVRRGAALSQIGSPFDMQAHGVDVRRINSGDTAGRHAVPSVGVFVWRLRACSVTRTPASCVDGAGGQHFTFSVLGNDAPVYLKPEPERDPSHIAEPFNLPVPIARDVLAAHKDRIVGPERSLAIWTGVKRDGAVSLELVATDRIVAADLSGWTYQPRRGTVAVDPVLGRIAFPAQHPPRHGVWVSYHYGFSADIGGGEYDRPLSQPAGAVHYGVSDTGPFDTIGRALDRWRSDRPRDAVIEIDDSRVYVEPIHVDFAAGQASLQLRAASGRRPVIRLLDWQTSQSDALTVTGAGGDRFVLDGMMVMGRGLQVGGDLRRLTVRHSTLVPGWGLHGDCSPHRPTEPSIEITAPNVCVTVEHSIVGPIQVNPQLPTQGEDGDAGREASDDDVQQARCQCIGPEARLDPVRLCLADSILDAMSASAEAIGAPGCPVAHAVVTIVRCTVIGQVQVRAVELGENTIFEGRMTVARRQHGCLRFSSVTPGSRTPPRFACQPDLVDAAVAESLRDEARAQGRPAPTDAEIAVAQAGERIRVRPQFNAVRYGAPDYCQLSRRCAREIVRGADDESEMGAFHDLFQPQREANLRARLDEYVPAGCDVGIIVAS